MKINPKKALAMLLSALMIMSSVLLPSAAFAKDADSKPYVEGEAIVVLKDNANSKFMKAASTSALYGNGYSQKNAYTFGTSEDALRVVIIKSDSLSTKQILKQMRNNSAVKYAVPNSIMRASSITDDEYSKYQWALDNTGQNFGTVGSDVNADALWEKASQSEKEQVVAIVDTGIDEDNEELKDVLWNNPYGKKLLGKHGLDFTGTQKDREPHDDNGHGTHCAGIIAAAANNQKGISGINTSNVKIMALKFLDEYGSGTTEGALGAYDYMQRAIKFGTNVIACNNSWGGVGDSAERDLYDSIYDELGKLGVITFVSAGNEASELGKSEDSFFLDEDYYTIPACCNSPYCVTVAASNESDELAGFSNYSEEYVDVAAPGTDILSTVSYNCFNPSIYTDSQKSELCASYQSYETELSEGDFGYLKAVPSGIDYYVDGTNYDISYTDGFGLEGKAIRLFLNDELPKKKILSYAFEIPFTVADKDKDYSVSFMMKGNNNYSAAVYDVPAEKSVADIFDEDTSIIDPWGDEVGNYWDHYTADVDIDEFEDYYDYTPAVNRKLVIIIQPNKQGTEVIIDDLAISAQLENTDAFGKYDFYNGTSMATPYATGAAALIKNASPESTTLDIINIIKNAGRSSEALKGKTQTGKVLSLEDISNIPPMITGAEYNNDKKIEITGSFANISEVSVNDRKVEPISVTNNKIIIADDNYSTKKITIAVTNNVGTDKYTCFVSAKPIYNIKKLDMKPDVSGETFAVTAGGAAYFVTSYGSIYCCNHYEDNDSYDCYDIGSIDLTKVFPKDQEGFAEISSVAYMNNTIYAVAIGYVNAQYSGDLIGYETALLAYNMDTMETAKVAEIPDEAICGATLAVYKGDIYLLGGIDIDTYAFSDLMFRLDKKNGKFTKLSTTLPEGRAFTSFIQFRDKLVGMYGANEKAVLPSIIVFDGKNWKTSAVELESEDVAEDLLIDENKKLSIYEGNLGYGENGVFANGSYIYNVGDTFTYNADTDKLTPSKYSSRNSISEKALIGTTVSGGFIGFRQEEAAEEGEYAVGSLSLIKGDVVENPDVLDYPDGEDYEPTEEACTLKIKNEYPYIENFDVVNGYVKTPYQYYFNYGESVDVELVMNAGYVNTAIKFNGTVVSNNSNKATVVVSAVKNSITNTTKLVASPITSFKVKSAKNGKIKLAWNKAKAGAGYQVQQYKNNKWVTVKTINALKTNTCSATVKAGATAKYRVRVFGKNGSATVYGEAKAKTLYVPKKQNLKAASGAKGAFTVKYNKDAKATGYEIEFAKTNKFKSPSYAFAKKAATVNKKVSGVNKGKYYVRVRSYKTVDGVKIYGAYSAAKQVTVK